MAITPEVRETDAYRRALETLGSGRRFVFLSACPAVFGQLVAALLPDTGRAAAVILPDEVEAGRFLGDLTCFMPPEHAWFFPAPDFFTEPSDAPRKTDAKADALQAAAESVSETMFDRVRVLAGLAADGPPRVTVTHLQALLKRVPTVAEMRACRRQLAPGTGVRRDELIETLLRFGYAEKELVEIPGDFARRGGILDLFPPDERFPVRIELSGTSIASLRRFDIAGQRSFERIVSLTLLPVSEQFVSLSPVATLADFLAGAHLFFVRHRGESRLREAIPGDARDRFLSAADIEELAARSTLLETSPAAVPGRETIVLTTIAAGARFRLAPEETWDPYPGERLVVFSSNPSQESRLREVLAERDIPADTAVFRTGVLSAGFSLPERNTTFLSNDEIFGRYRTRHAPPRRLDSVPVLALEDLRPGDLVVHYNEGIGRFRGLVALPADDREEEYIHLEYADESRLYVPLGQIGLIHKYVGSSVPELSRLGGRGWIRVRDRVKESIRDMAADLYRLYLERRKERGFSFLPDNEWEREFEESFLYRETPDQEKAIAEIKADMVGERIMDRLVCGDSGYGKTEVAMRAAFKAVMSGKQVAVLAPTTVLALQHAFTFRERFADFPVRIEMLSRFVPRERQGGLLKELAEGSVDIVVGTHRLLQEDVRLKDLGLLIIDEEQRFGVTHKELVKARFRTVDVLTLTATPIPRTLYLSLSGLRSISLIETPPLGRLSVITHVGHHDPSLVREAVVRELDRRGQVFYLHNFIHDIEQVRRRLGRLVPDARVGVAHGRMDPVEIERVMAAFSEGSIDVLVATTIVENGLDIPRANTLIVDNAHRFGLADLYQLRGRIGRYKWRAYAYFLVPAHAPVTDEAMNRLAVLRELNRPGSGFKVAMKDLEIRGAGNILGREQHGFIEQIGFHLYCRFWKEVMSEVKGEPVPPPAETPFAAAIPRDYVTQPGLRLWLYRSVAAVSSRRQADELIEELRDRFGPVPEPLVRLVGARAARVDPSPLPGAGASRRPGRPAGPREGIPGPPAGHIEDPEDPARQRAGRDRRRGCLDAAPPRSALPFPRPV